MKVTLTPYTRRHFTCKAATYPNPCPNFGSPRIKPLRVQIREKNGDVAVWYPHRQFIGHIHDTCSQLTWNLRTHRQTYSHNDMDYLHGLSDFLWYFPRASVVFWEHVKYCTSSCIIHTFSAITNCFQTHQLYVTRYLDDAGNGWTQKWYLK